MMVWLLDGTQVLEHRECKTILLPDGQPAAIWRGLAYPILADGVSIDVTSPGISPEECTAKFECPRIVHIEETAEAVYLIGSGSVVAREALIFDLKRNSFSVERSGHYTGPTHEGLDGDWFVRVRKHPHFNRETFDQLIDAGFTVEKKPQDLRLMLLEQELANARSCIAAERAQIAKLKLEIASLSEDALLIEKLKREVDTLNKEAISLAEAAQRDPQVSHVNRSKKWLFSEIEDVLEVLLSRVRLLRDSMDVATIEYSDRKGMYRSLQELHQETIIPTHWKPVRGAPGWIERHVSNGINDSGRIYARLGKADRKWEILLSDKSSQSRDIGWLQKN